MKTNIFLLLVIVSFVSCRKTKELFDIPFNYTANNSFTLPKVADREYAVPDSSVTITTPDITNTAPDEFKKNNANINSIKSVSIQEILLSIPTSSNQNFSFLKSVKIYLGSQGKAERLIATKDDINTISPAPTSLSLAPENADIAEYIKSPTYYFKVQMVLVKTYTQDIPIQSAIKFHVVANPLN